MNRLPSLAALALLSCAHKAAEPAPVAQPAPAAAPLPKYASSLLDAMDPSVSACEDFYQYACGGWVKQTPLPADKPIWTRSFSQIADNNLASQRTLLDEIVKSPGSDPVRTRLAAFYGSCVDEGAADAAGLSPLKPLFEQIDTVKDAKSFQSIAGRLAAVGVPGLVGFDVDSDFKNPDIADLYLYQSGLSLPDRDYYLKTDDASKALVVALQARVAEVLVQTGTAKDKAEKLAADVIAFERALAEASVPRAELRDPEKIYHPTTRADLVKSTPGLAWESWLAGLGAAQVDNLVSATPEVFKRFQTVLNKTDGATLRAYLKWQTVHAYAGTLDGATYAADFALFGQKVVGQKEPEARWKRCVKATNSAMGEALGQAWVEQNFPGDSKAIAQTMLKNIVGAFKVGLPRLEWMDDPTRQRAVEKADSLAQKIGYPDKWRDYSSLEVATGKYADNTMAARRFETARVLAKVGKPVDKGEWFMTPPVVNAYYNPTWNEMVFPAGILQPPFFQHDYPAALNYGGIGMVMGHELTHGFDDSGRKFDGSGKLVEWWAPEVSARFEERAACVEKQYNAYEVAPGLNVNGALTLGENIADLGGLRLAYRAFKTSLADGKKAEIPGLTEDQAFFVSFAQGWCTVASPEFEKMLVLSNPHSPDHYRVNGPLQNLPEFHAAFNCGEGAKMRSANMCEVW